MSAEVGEALGQVQRGLRQLVHETAALGALLRPQARKPRRVAGRPRGIVQAAVTRGAEQAAAEQRLQRTLAAARADRAARAAGSWGLR